MSHQVVIGDQASWIILESRRACEIWQNVGDAMLRQPLEAEADRVMPCLINGSTFPKRW